MRNLHQKNAKMQATISRQNHFQNLISLAVPMLIICYYAFNGVPNDTLKNTSFAIESSQEQNKNIELETSISHLRAAVLMDADAVQINGLLYEVENSLGNFTSKQKAQSVVQKINKNILSGNRKQAVRLINQLPTLLLLK
jgi:hypothetical protein